MVCYAVRTMGDIADDIIGWMEDALDDCNGLYDDLWADEFYPKRVKKIPTCRYCGKSPLRWRQINDKWVPTKWMAITMIVLSIHCRSTY
jgi:hypothetical protein